MAEILQRSRVEHIKEYSLFFAANDGRGGFGFPCNEHGQVRVAELNDVAFGHYQACINSGVTPRIQDQSYDYRAPAIVRCVECRRGVTLTAFTNTCDCGADYNLSGQRLAPRSQWGEETGETYSDITMGGWDE